MLPHPAAPGSIPGILQKNSEEKIVDDPGVNLMGWFEESGQCLENADQTYLVLASVKLVLQKYNEEQS